MKSRAQQTTATPQKTARKLKLASALKRNMARRKAAPKTKRGADER